MNPLHAAERSKLGTSVAPRASWMKQALAGKGMSGVIVQQIIRSRSLVPTPALSSALRAASMASVTVDSPLVQMWRSLIPVRVVIHSSDVSRIFSKSALVMTLSGTAEPMPVIIARRDSTI